MKNCNVHPFAYPTHNLRPASIVSYCTSSEDPRKVRNFFVDYQELQNK